MIIRKAYKYRLNTKPETKQLMSQYAGNCRFLWNKALAVNLHYLENKQPMLWYQELDWTGLANSGKKVITMNF